MTTTMNRGPAGAGKTGRRLGAECQGAARRVLVSPRRDDHLLTPNTPHPPRERTETLS